MKRKIVIDNCEGCLCFVPSVEKDKKAWCSDVKKYFNYEEGLFPKICELEEDR